MLSGVEEFLTWADKACGLVEPKDINDFVTWSYKSIKDAPKI